MLFFEHPVNRAREASGRATVDYIWTWGGGTLPGTTANARATAVFADAPLVRELSRALGRESAALPALIRGIHRAGRRNFGPGVAGRDEQHLDVAATCRVRRGLGGAVERAIDKGEVTATLIIAGAARTLSFTPRATGALRRLRRRWSAPPTLDALLAMDGDA